MWLTVFCCVCGFFFSQSQTTSYFARKFEAIVNQEVITKLDGWLYGEYPQNTPGLRYYWENMFHHEDSLTKTSDIFRTFFHSFSRLATEKINRPTQTPGGGSSCHVTSLGTIREVTYLNQQDQLGGLLVLFDVESVSGDGAKSVHTVEAWMAPQIHEELLNLNASKGPQRLTGLQVSRSFVFAVRLALFCLSLRAGYPFPARVPNGQWRACS